MGFLLFASRKLQLKKQINQLNYREMQLSQEQQTISEKIKNVQLAQQQAQNTMNIFTAGINAVQTTMNGAQAMTQINAGSNAQSVWSAMGNNSMMQPAQLAANVMNSVFTAQNQVQLAELNAKDSQISLEIENIQSQEQLLQAEYNNVKKAEGQEAQNCAPTFGLA